MQADSLSITTPTEREVLIERFFDAPRELIWDAHTKPDLIKRWLTGPPGNTLPICEIDLQVGGVLRYVWHGPDGAPMAMTGEFREIVCPERIVYTELYEDVGMGGENLVTTVFSEENGKTKMSMTVRFQNQEARDANLAYGMAEGLGASYASLDQLLAE